MNENDRIYTPIQISDNGKMHRLILFRNSNIYDKYCQDKTLGNNLRMLFPNEEVVFSVLNRDRILRIELLYPNNIKKLLQESIINQGNQVFLEFQL